MNIAVFPLCVLCNIPVYAVPCVDGDIRFVVVGTYDLARRIELCVNKSWGIIRSDSWDDVDASVACKQAGYSPYGQR